MKRPIAVIDVETTSLHPFRWNSYVVELGVVIVSPALEKVWRCEWKVRVPDPLVVFTKEFWSAKRIHKKTLREMFGWKNYTIGQVVNDLRWLHETFPDAIIGGQNVGFDYMFVKSMYEFDGKVCEWDYHLLDLTSLAAAHLGVTSLTGKAHRGRGPEEHEPGIADVLGLHIDPEKRHTALGDAELTADALIALLKRIEDERIDAGKVQ